jgi:NodT family efflux transporter outer membrane factor (OMF) lipoprotein
MTIMKRIIHSTGKRLACATPLLAALVAACTVGPNFVRPAPATPPHWSPTAAGPPSQSSKLLEQASELRDWWKGFADPLLNTLIERAMVSNLDLRTAMLRIDESRAERAIAAAAYWPSLSVDASFIRQRFSETTPTGALFNSVGAIHLPGGAAISVPNPYNQLTVSAGASWEIDLFGRIRRSVEAADAGVQVSVEDHRAVLLSVIADVAHNYMALRGAQERLRIAKENLSTVAQLLELTRQRRAAGLTTHIDVSNATAQAAATQAELPAFELQITQAINQLSQLLGQGPDALRAELAPPAAVPAVPLEVTIGLPADLARRRPDIREAEANLHSASAQIGLAVANLFPRLSLSAEGGVQSATAGHLFEWASRFGSIGPSLDVPIFDRGRWKTVRLYDVRAQEAALTYQRTVLNALHDVENALTAYAADQQRRAWFDATVAQNREALDLTQQRYKGGLITFIDVLDVERTLQQNQMSLVDSNTAVSSDLVLIYRALGGGWQQGAAPAM